MNIFKILANGDGTINEANVSAFLGYLIDPKADHALGFEFLKRFLKNSVDEENFDFEKFEYEIFYEQAFKEVDKSKQIVDIVVACYSINKGLAKESLLKNFIENKKTVHKIFLIENKIKAGSITEGQLINQFQSTKYELGDEYLDKLHSIYITPQSKTLKNEFLQNAVANSTHIFWKSTEDAEISVYSMIKEILELENNGSIEPLNEYTIHTIKAFNQFIENDFKSEKQEEKERLNDGSYIKKFEELNRVSNIEQKLKNLKSSLIQFDANYKEILAEVDMSEKRHPVLPAFVNGIRLNIGAGYSTRDKVGFSFTIDRNNENSKNQLMKLANQLKIELKKPNDKYGSYCRTENMKRAIKLININEIETQTRECINQMNEIRHVTMADHDHAS